VAAKDGKNRIMLVSAADGSVSVLKILDKYYGLRDSSWYTPKNMSLSPDGRYIVYDFPQREDSHDISLMSTDGSREIPLVEHPANDYVLGWAPDGKNVIFASDRTGTMRIWLIAVADGKPQAAPEMVKMNIGRFGPMGFTDDGSFYYSHSPSPSRNDVHIEEIESETGNIVVPPQEAVNSYIESNTTPAYSPDGKYLVYISRRPPPLKMYNRTTPLGNVICVRSLEAGEQREFQPSINSFGFPQWSPDSRSIMVVNFEDDNKNVGLYRIDAQTGKSELVVMSEDNKIICGHLWCADGNSIFIVRYVRTDDQDKHFCQIVVRDIESGVENELYRGGQKDLFSISLSPDGKWLAFLDKAKRRALRVMPAAGGEPREIYIFNEENYGYIPHTWTADGKYVLMPKSRPSEDDAKWDLCRIPVEGGEPQNFGFETGSILQLSAHPDGQHIAFCTTAPKTPEVWVMENFLPATVAAAK
jgi:Tol biopolymer transport system component